MLHIFLIAWRWLHLKKVLKPGCCINQGACASAAGVQLRLEVWLWNKANTDVWILNSSTLGYAGCILPRVGRHTEPRCVLKAGAELQSSLHGSSWGRPAVLPGCISTEHPCGTGLLWKWGGRWRGRTRRSHKAIYLASNLLCFPAITTNISLLCFPSF